MYEVLILSPSFSQWSDRPLRTLREAGVSVRYPEASSPLSSRQVREELGGADAVIVALDELDAAAISAGRNLKVIAKHGVGVDNIDVGRAALGGITVVNAPGMNSTAVADLVMGLLLALQRKIVDAHNSLLEGRWERFHGPELVDRTMAILGFGRIGHEVAKRAHGFGMRVIAYDPFLAPAEFERAGVERCEEIDAALAEADVVTLHLPSTGTGPLLGGEAIGRMKPGAVLVNAARGDLVDEDAVVAALRDGALAGYAADAFAVEPPVGRPLLTAPNVVFTPHIGAFTDHANELMGMSVVEDILAVLSGRAPRHPVIIKD
ncbi:phosphoglycerate dehydrogenase [Brooklawnia cerclae]|nr:phosphoglycerate dehydrogenase [Brooklawnia cerclae]